MNLTWADIDFEDNQVSFAPKKESKFLLEWEPKDNDSRTIPIPEKTIQLLADLQAQSDETTPYVFISGQRLNRILQRRILGKWTATSDIINNMLKRLKIFCKKAGIEEFCFHDLRRSCITNWAKSLPIHAVQELVGHSKIETTRTHYLSVRKSDRELARQVSDEVFGKLMNF